MEGALGVAKEDAAEEGEEEGCLFLFGGGVLWGLFSGFGLGVGFWGGGGGLGFICICTCIRTQNNVQTQPHTHHSNKHPPKPLRTRGVVEGDVLEAQGQAKEDRPQGFIPW